MMVTKSPLCISSREVKPFVAIGAMKVAKAAREDQWVRL